MLNLNEGDLPVKTQVIVKRLSASVNKETVEKKTNFSRVIGTSQFMLLLSLFGISIPSYVRVTQNSCSLLSTFNEEFWCEVL